MNGTLHHFQISDEYKAFAVFHKSLFLVRNYNGKIKIKGQNMDSNAWFYIDFLKEMGQNMKILNIFIRIIYAMYLHCLSTFVKKTISNGE